MVFKVILINTKQNTQHCMNGEADNSRMHVYMHLAFKDLRRDTKSVDVCTVLSQKSEIGNEMSSGGGV